MFIGFSCQYFSCASIVENFQLMQGMLDVSIVMTPFFTAGCKYRCLSFWYSTGAFRSRMSCSFAISVSSLN